MTDEQTGSASAGDDQAGDGAGKQAKSFGRRANSNLRSARRSLEASDWQTDERARHLVAEANVLALLDLADAIRTRKP
jgi:hypothetical protein